MEELNILDTHSFFCESYTRRLIPISSLCGEYEVTASLALEAGVNGLPGCVQR